MRHRSAGEPDYLQIHEVHYSDDGSLNGFSETPAAIGGESIEEIREVIERIKMALDQPILDYN